MRYSQYVGRFTVAYGIERCLLVCILSGKASRKHVLVGLCCKFIYDFTVRVVVTCTIRNRCPNVDSSNHLLQYVHNLMPRGQYTSGKGSSAVGLTAYVTRDPETRQLVLQTLAPLLFFFFLFQSVTKSRLCLFPVVHWY